MILLVAVDKTKSFIFVVSLFLSSAKTQSSTDLFVFCAANLCKHSKLMEGQPDEDLHPPTQVAQPVLMPMHVSHNIRSVIAPAKLA